MGLSLTGKHPENDCGSEPQKCLSLGSGKPHESVRSKLSRPISGDASERILAMAPVRDLPLNFPRVVSNPTKEAHHEVGRTDHAFTKHSVIRRRMQGERNRPTGMVPGWKRSPLRKDPLDQTRRRITDVVNRSGAEMDTPQEGPQGEEKPESNGHGCWRRDSTHALKMTRR
jgi:hypothetical protein